MRSSALSNAEAYDLWAEAYPPLPHNPLMRAEQSALAAMWPDVRGLTVLDLASGTGRYGLQLEQRGAACVIATDMSEQMLLRAPLQQRVRADMMCLPFAAEQFDLIVCGLAVGHAPSLDGWMAEMARVLRPGGLLVYSDFHADAARAGMTRSFTDRAKRKHVLLHALFDLEANLRAAAKAGFEIERSQELRVGYELHEAFDGSQVFYSRWQGLAVVLAVRARKLA